MLVAAEISAASVVIDYWTTSGRSHYLRTLYLLLTLGKFLALFGLPLF